MSGTFVMRRNDLLAFTQGNKAAAEALNLLVYWWKKFPRKLKITQQQLANKLHYHRETISKALRLLVQLEAISWELNPNDGQSRTRRYVVHVEKLREFFPTPKPTKKAEKPTEKEEKPTVNVENSTSPINKEIDPFLNPSKPNPPILLSEDEREEEEGGASPIEKILDGEETPSTPLASADTFEKEEIARMQGNFETKCSANPNSKRIRVVDSRLGFGDGENPRLASQRSRAARYVAREIVPPEEAREFQKQFAEWESLQGVEPRYSRVSNALLRVEAGEYVLEWEEFCRGIPMGTLNKHDWQHRRGITHRALLQYHARELTRVGESFSQGLAKARALFKDAATAQQAWESWGRRVMNAQAENERLAALGVKGLTMPTELKPLARTEPQQVVAALQSLIGEDATMALPSGSGSGDGVAIAEKGAERAEPAPEPEASDSASNLEKFALMLQELKARKSFPKKSKTREIDPQTELEKLNADLSDPVLRSDRGIQARAARLAKDPQLIADYDDSGLICCLSPLVQPRPEIETLRGLLTDPDIQFEFYVQQRAERFVKDNGDRYLAVRDSKGLIVAIEEPDF